MRTKALHRRGSAPAAADTSWIDDEVDGDAFQDERLGKRFKSLLGQFTGGTGESMPLACQDWANTKAAYRFFAKERGRGLPINRYVTKIARFGGYLNRNNDGPPNNVVIWRGLARLSDMTLEIFPYDKTHKRCK